MSASIQNTITRDGKTWERISGPWSIAETTSMIKDITRFERSGIKCITEIHNGDTWVYRDSKGYIQTHGVNYQNNPGIPRMGSFLKEVINSVKAKEFQRQ